MSQPRQRQLPLRLQLPNRHRQLQPPMLRLLRLLRLPFRKFAACISRLTWMLFRIRIVPQFRRTALIWARTKDVKVRVAGNCDERGSSEYNLALGQRRANNVKKLLVLSGAHASQIETVSFGEEKPRCAEHNEACWSQNRRADIVYPSK